MQLGIRVGQIVRRMVGFGALAVRWNGESVMLGQNFIKAVYLVKAKEAIAGEIVRAGATVGRGSR